MVFLKGSASIGNQNATTALEGSLTDSNKRKHTLTIKPTATVLVFMQMEWESSSTHSSALMATVTAVHRHGLSEQ